MSCPGLFSPQGPIFEESRKEKVWDNVSHYPSGMHLSRSFDFNWEAGMLWGSSFSLGMPGAGREGDEKSPLKMKGSGIWDWAGICFFFSWHHPYPCWERLVSLDGSQCQGKQVPSLLLKGKFGAGGMGWFGCHWGPFPHGKPFLGCPRLHALLL